MTGQITLERTPHLKQVFAKALLDAPIPFTIARVCKETGLDYRTVKEISRRNDYKIEAIQAIQKRLPAKFYITSDWALDNLTPAKMEACSAPQLMMVAGIAIDKARDMEGLNRPVINLVELSASIGTAIKEARERMSMITQQLALTEANNEKR